MFYLCQQATRRGCKCIYTGRQATNQNCRHPGLETFNISRCTRDALIKLVLPALTSPRIEEAIDKKVDLQGLDDRQYNGDNSLVVALMMWNIGVLKKSAYDITPDTAYLEIQRERVKPSDRDRESFTANLGPRTKTVLPARLQQPTNYVRAGAYYAAKTNTPHSLLQARAPGAAAPLKGRDVQEEERALSDHNMQISLNILHTQVIPCPHNFPTSRQKNHLNYKYQVRPQFGPRSHCAEVCSPTQATDTQAHPPGSSDTSPHYLLSAAQADTCQASQAAPCTYQPRWCSITALSLTAREYLLQIRPPRCRLQIKQYAGNRQPAKNGHAMQLAFGLPSPWLPCETAPGDQAGVGGGSIQWAKSQSRIRFEV